MPLYEFHCATCETVHEKMFKYDERPKEIPCEECQIGVAEYHVGRPACFRVKFDNNGRVGFKYDMGNGKQTYRSATRESYEHNLGNKSEKILKEMGNDKGKSVYTKEYSRMTETKQKENFARIEKSLHKKTRNT